MTTMIDREEITVRVDGQDYRVENIPGDRPALRADLIRRGFDGESYTLTGRYGAVVLAYRRPTGEYVIQKDV